MKLFVNVGHSQGLKPDVFKWNNYQKYETTKFLVKNYISSVLKATNIMVLMSRGCKYKARSIEIKYCLLRGTKMKPKRWSVVWERGEERGV